MKKIIVIGAETFSIIIIRTTVSEDSYNPTVGDHHTWTVKAFHGNVLLYTDKTRAEDNVLTLVRAAHDYIERGATKTDMPQKTLEQKLSEMGFN